MSSTGGSRAAVERVWSELPAEARSVLLDGLSPTDLQTLLLDVARTRAHRVDAARLASRWQRGAFLVVRPGLERPGSRGTGHRAEPAPGARAGLDRAPDPDPGRLRFRDHLLDLRGCGVGRQILDEVGPDVPSLVEDRDREHGRGYDAPAAMKITARGGAGEQEIGDGGFTDWTARLTADAKERCLISGVATERLLAATATQ